MKLNTTLGVSLIGAAAITGAGWMMLPSLQASQRAVNIETREQVERARRLLHKFDHILERKSLLLDRLSSAGVDVDVEDPADLADAAADFYQQEHESAWEAYPPMDWESTPPRKARASYGNIERQMRDAITDRADLIGANEQWLDEALDAINQALALREDDADARSNTEANRLKSVIQFHLGLTAWLRADVKRHEASRFRRELVDTATKIAEFLSTQTIIEDSGVDNRIQQLHDKERETVEALANRKNWLAEVDDKIATLETQLSEATNAARAAEESMRSLRNRGADFEDPNGMETFKRAFAESDRAYRNAHRRIQLLQAGDYSNATIDRPGEFLSGTYLEDGSDVDLTVTPGIRHYQAERDVAVAELEVIEHGLEDHRTAIERLEGLRNKLQTDGEQARRQLPDAIDTASTAFDELNRLESEAFAIEEDALNMLEKAVRAAKQAAGNARSDLANAGERLRKVSMEARDKSAFSLSEKDRWIGGHIAAQIADARLAKAWIYHGRYSASSRNAELLERSGDVLQLKEADSETEDTKASEAHDAGVDEIAQAMTQLQQAHRAANRHWTFVAQQAATNHLMALFGHADYRKDAIDAYRNAVSGREDQPSAKLFVERLERLENR